MKVDVLEKQELAARCSEDTRMYRDSEHYQKSYWYSQRIRTYQEEDAAIYLKAREMYNGSTV